MGDAHGEDVSIARTARMGFAACRAGEEDGAGGHLVEEAGERPHVDLCRFILRTDAKKTE
jgi:hypothetical protein